MQYELQIFQDPERREFRAIDIDGEPWFVLADVCRALETGNVSQAASRLDADEKGIITTDTLGGPQATVIVNESGLFSLILTSRKEGAKRFKKWITSEVLPSIRRTGGYRRPAQVSAEWQPFHDRITAAWGTVPEGYFSIFKEMADLIALLITQGVKVDHKTIPDGSLGSAWSKQWDEIGGDYEYGDRIRYPHCYPPSFPQSRSNPQPAYAYPEDALSVFRRWLRQDYLKVGMPKYLIGKAARGEMPREVANAVLGSIGAPMLPEPKPRIPYK